MARLKALARDEMDAEQQALMDEIASGPRKAPMTNGPGLGWLRPAISRSRWGHSAASAQAIPTT